jgi:type I restriction enzyme S subunit
MKLRKDKWEKVRIGEVISELRESSSNPIEEGYEKYIGFEHIEPENLYLTQFGKLNDGITFKKTFKANDILFGKIRAYLKKVAIAPIDGICSGDILVLRTKNEKRLTQKLLPYFLTTESFLKRAVDSSIGTTLPRTKWQHLSKHEISLPPFEEQKQIAALF